MFVGIDVGKFEHQAAFLDDSGAVARPSLRFSNSDDGFNSLFELLGEPTDSIVIGMEATGHYWLNLYSALITRDFTTHVINPIQTDAMRRVNIRKAKTDSVDCVYIAKLLKLGDFTDVSVSSDDIAELRQLCRYRYGLVDSISSLKNQITGIVDRIFPEYHQLFSDVFGATSIELLKRYTTPDALGKVSAKRLTEIVSKYSRGRFGEAKALEIKAACKSSVGCVQANPAFVFQLRQQIALIEFSQQQLAEIELRIEDCYSRFPCCLHSIPGLGVTSAAVILSEVGNIDLFESPKKLVAFAGLDASVYQSGNFTASQSHISKRGSPYLRRALWNAAEAACRFNPVLADFYARKRSEGKNHMVAIGAVARKLCYICFAILRDNVPFDPSFSS